ncbi:RecQ family ATP-dependent DNA helicase [Dethiobacter alkaliphilus]|uniref:RecQ family ATP-dependent DNA helicase n=1 Tax=Dethiobacter alkaliphilus TaxID=427926 RepID=UPI002227D048|nr:RecQ family ATP-dependent DNA helicase [Dethiobacter alkaliphilus]MCW3490221.1 RecQ family ATP-dependent DNA helicase [Dethiobacter alkaliphilus]
MRSIAYIDLEVQPRTGAILDIGGINDAGNVFHSKSMAGFINYLKSADYLCGHNIIKHDLKYIQSALENSGIATENVIDTLYLSALLFPKKPYHALVKDEKLQTDELNNPVNDSKKVKELFADEVVAFKYLEEPLKQIYYLLLQDQKEFRFFFKYLGYEAVVEEPVLLIKKHFASEICEHADFRTFIEEHPVELAFALAVINVKDRFSVTPPWILKNYPEVERIMDFLRNRPCLRGCSYCEKALDARRGLKWFFGFDSYRTYGGEPLQENAVKAAIDNKSLLAIFPTGGGKSITFQVPALMSGESVKGLTVVISPLQSLMKDQVDNLEKAGIMDSVTINGLLDPIERAKSIERVVDGSASILYISPEILRSRTIEHILLGRKIVRFVIDEAHCFSAWGQDFRVVYLYIGDFIKTIQEKKSLAEGIPVSCFTATAKQKVIEDIQIYFKNKLGIELEVFSSSAARTNLRYKVLEKKDQDEKYNTLRNLLEQKDCPTIVYVSRTRMAYDLAERLTKDGYLAKPYHGKMDKKEKSENQDAFIAGEVPIMVATSAFGMGVDKKDVGMVIHFEISDSLENYIQEAGRAGRDENITADCYILYCEDDLDKHFVLLNQTRINIKEIQQVWRAIKGVTRFRNTVSQSALEIARKAGWDEGISGIETRVRTAIAALEESGYIRRGQNMPKIFADSILCRTAQEAIAKINASELFDEKEKEYAVRIIKKLISSRSLSNALNEEAESRVDYISDQLGIEKEKVICMVNLMREEGILADAKDLSAYIKQGERTNRSLQLFESYSGIEKYLAGVFEDQEATYNLKELNEEAENSGCTNVNPNKIRVILNYWTVKKMIKYKSQEYSKNHIRLIVLESKEKFRERLEKRQELARFVIEYLYSQGSGVKEEETEEILVDFSVHELKRAYEESMRLFKSEVSIADIEDTLFYLSRIEAIKIEGGFLVVYNPMTIERLEEDNKIRYKLEDYQKLDQFYESKIQQIHIVGEYAKKMIDNYRQALQFVEDYFRLNYASFLSKYFQGSRGEEIRLNISPGKFRQLFGELSPTQLSIIKDNQNKHIAVLAGPGSGKTRVLVHKLASLILMEDVKHEQLLMLTFSRAAATEFKIRLRKLVGGAANFIEIKTFHSYCFDLLGKVGNAEKFDDVVKATIEKIQNGEVDPGRITKTVLVLDEAQDMDQDVYSLVQALMAQNEDMRVIAVGDDDQNIYEFRGSSSEYLEQFMLENQAAQYELLENYRSKRNLVDFSNRFASLIRGRLKKNEIMAHCQENGDIRILQYSNNNLLVPFVEDLSATELVGSTCVLTQTNDEALQVTGLLLQRGIPARLIHTNEGFSLYDLVEMRFFLEQLTADPTTIIVSDDIWNRAKRALVKKYGKSEILDICKRIILDFEAIYQQRKYLSDFEVFIKESKLEDFYTEARETIFVSTIHKAKGKEFDNVFLLLENFKLSTEEKKRQLYVAMTRAKSNLSIHLDGRYLDHIRVENLIRLEDMTHYELPEKLAMQLSYRDVWLDYFIGRQFVVDSLISGDTLQYKDGEWLSDHGKRVLRPSKRCAEQIERVQKNGYEPQYAKVNFIVFWRKEGQEQEIKIVLPELHFERKKEGQTINEDSKLFANS